MKLYTIFDEDAQLLQEFPEQGWQRRAKKKISEKQKFAVDGRNLAEIYKNVVLKEYDRLKNKRRQKNFTR